MSEGFSSVAQTWQRLESWFAENLPAVLNDLNPGCDEHEFRVAEERLGIDLPETLKEVYRLHNGQRFPESSIVGIFYGVYFLSLSQMLDQWQTWADTNKLIDAGGYRDQLDDGQFSFVPEKVKPIYSSNSWIPFGLIAENCYLGLDYDPAPEGAIGQVINFGREEEQKTLVAHSFSDFLSRYVYTLEQGNFLFANDGGWIKFLPKNLAHRVLEGRSPYLGATAQRFIDDEGSSIL